MPEPVRTPAELFDLTDRVALVTGASSGLGRRIALVLAAAGATVAVTARRVDRLVELESEAPALRGFPCDLTRANEREALVTDMIELNLTAAWHLMKLVGVSMVEREHGSIINIASILGVVGATPAKDSGYSAAKGGLVNLTREMGLQWARKGVRVNAICPGWFKTEMIEDLTSTENGSSFITSNTPMMRVGQVNEIDGAVLLLASDAGSFMTGSIVMVDGGWTAR